MVDLVTGEPRLCGREMDQGSTWPVKKKVLRQKSVAHVSEYPFPYFQRALNTIVGDISDRNFGWRKPGHLRKKNTRLHSSLTADFLAVSPAEKPNVSVSAQIDVNYRVSARIVRDGRPDESAGRVHSHPEAHQCPAGQRALPTPFWPPSLSSRHAGINSASRDQV